MTWWKCLPLGIVLCSLGVATAWAQEPQARPKAKIEIRCIARKPIEGVTDPNDDHPEAIGYVHIKPALVVTVANVEEVTLSNQDLTKHGLSKENYSVTIHLTAKAKEKLKATVEATPTAGLYGPNDKEFHILAFVVDGERNGAMRYEIDENKENAPPQCLAGNFTPTFSLHNVSQVKRVVEALVSPNGAKPAASGTDPSANVRSRITPQNLVKLRELETLEREAKRIRLRPDGRRIAFVRVDNPVEILGADLVGPFRKVGNETTRDYVFSTDPNIVAYSTNGPSAFVLDLRTKKQVHIDTSKDEAPYETHKDMASLAFSPDGKLLVTGSYYTGAKVWDAKTGKLLRKLDMGKTKGGLWPVFSPNGKVLAVGHRNSKPRLFDPATGRLLHVLDETASFEVAFSPDGKTLAIVYVDGIVVLWDVATGKRLQEAKSDAEELFTVCWSPDGKLLATAGLNGSVTLWSPDGLKPLKQLKPAEWISAVCFTPDGTQLLAGGKDGVTGDRRKVWRWGIR